MDELFESMLRDAFAVADPGESWRQITALVLAAQAPAYTAGDLVFFGRRAEARADAYADVVGRVCTRIVEPDWDGPTDELGRALAVTSRIVAWR